ncbi:MAG: Rpn family recombination-promoting nuclease/putative transposase [Deltaproteobacteria bacterium]|nr:Rpn family recombination-promoting nuclease/putative transposase [Deltaproteobacteria bacterium]
MTVSTNLHDRFFKEVFSGRDVAQDFLRHYLPMPVLDLLDLSTLEAMKDSFVDEQLRAHFSDLVYRISMKLPQPAYVCLLLEHKSYPDRQVPVQLLRYMAQIWGHVFDQQPGIKYLPVIIPLVFYHGAARWSESHNLGSLFDINPTLAPHFPDYRYLLFDLSTMTDEEIRGAAKTRMTLLVQKYFFDDKLLDKLGELSCISKELPADGNRDKYLRSVAQYLLGTDKITRKDLENFLDQATDGRGGDIMPTIAETIFDEGLQQGLQQGLQRGVLQEAQKAVIEVLEARFGAIPRAAADVVAELLDITLLRSLRKQAVMSSSLEEFTLLLEESRTRH